MIRNKATRLLLVPALVGLLASLLVYRQLSTQATQAKKQMVAVVVTAKAVPAKTRLEQTMLSTTLMPKEFVNAQTVTNVKDALDRLTLVPLAQGEIILQSKLSSSDSRMGMSYRIPAGRRAQAVAVNDIIGAGGLIQPGDSVDVVAVFDKQLLGTDKGRLILENIPVLAVGRETSASATDVSQAGKAGIAAGQGRPATGTTVTLAVTPQEGVVLALAEEKGTLRLLLRPALDDGTKGVVDFATSVFTQAQPIDQVFEAKKQVRFRVALVEADSAALASLGVGVPPNGPAGGTIAYAVTSRALWDKTYQLVATGQAKELAKADLLTMNREQARYKLAGQVPATSKASGLELTSWYEFGLTAEMMPVVYKGTALDVTARVFLRILDLGSKGPFTTERSQDFAARLDLQKDMVAVTGLTAPSDFALPADVTSRNILPGGLVSDAVSSGRRQIVLLILPEVDQR